MEGLDLDYQANMYAGMVGKSRLMHERVFKKIDEVSPVDITVLILGETGVGKELASKAVHQRSARKRANWLPVNCAAIPDNLLESELYGHVRGAFTGAFLARDGAFKEANNGTIYLDEIGSMPLDQQPKLLRVLEDMKIKPVGSDKYDKVDVRVITGTNQDLYAAVRTGKFRKDLYYRLAAVTIEIPPLRERIGDIPMLIKYFMEKYQTEYGRRVPEFTPNEYIEYMRYNWPGNVREVENAVKGIVTSSVDKLEKLVDLKRVSALITVGVLPSSVVGLVHTSVPSQAWHDYQRDSLLSSLQRNNGDKRATAAELGISLKTVYNPIAAMRAEIAPEVVRQLTEDKSGEALIGLKELGQSAKEDVEAEAILHALDQCRWNRVKAAKMLRISYRALLYKIKDYGLRGDQLDAQAPPPSSIPAASAEGGGQVNLRMELDTGPELTDRLGGN